MSAIARLFILCLLSMMLSSTSLLAAESRQYDIVMVLWRGVTDAERGFMNYLKTSGVRANFIIKDCQKDASKLPGFINEIKTVRPDLVYTFGTTVTREIVGTIENRDPGRHILDIPVVFNIVADPVGAKLVESFASSNSNFTGVSHTVPLDAQINVMKKTRPLRKLAVIYNPVERNSQLAVTALQAQADAQGFTVIEAPVALDINNKPVKESIATRIKEVARLNPDFIYLPSDSFVISNASEVVNASLAQGVATFSSTEGPIRKNGALMGIVSTYYSVGKFAGFKASQLLTKAKATQDIPIETLRQFSLLVNAESARQLVFFPPVSMLAVAEVIQ